MKLPRQKREERSATITQTLALLLVLSLLCLSVLGLLAAPVPSGKPSNYPAWWFARGVIVQTNPTNSSPVWPTNYPASDDYAAINQGQLKNFATQGYAELQADAPSYVWSTSYGTNLTGLVTSWNPTNGDAYAAVNLGQLKTVAVSFYNVLIQMGYTNNYPWTGVGADDYAVANIGQAKNVFSFDVGYTSDGDGVPDWWEMEYFGQVGIASTNSLDGNGYTLAQDYAGGANPTNYYSWPGTGTNGPTTVVPSVAIISGNNQVSTAGSYAAAPLVVQVTNSNGGGTLTNAPVTFAMASGAGEITPGTPGSALGTNFSTTTDTNGDAQAYFQSPATNGVTNTITATAAGQSATFTETTSAGDGTFDAPSNLELNAASLTEIDLSWVNNASSATSIVVQESTNQGATWTTLATLGPTATSYAATNLNPDLLYNFRVYASK